MPQTLDLRRQWDAEACDLADDLGDPIARLHVNDYRSLTALEAGDLATMRDGVRHLRVRIRAGRTTAQPMADRLPPGVAAALDGDLEAAEHAATEALTSARRPAIRTTPIAVYGGQILTVRWMQGRLQEMVPLVEQAAHDNPGLLIFHASLAAAMSLDEPHEKVRRFLDTEITNDFEVFADASWLAAQVLWAHAVAGSGHRAGCEPACTNDCCRGTTSSRLHAHDGPRRRRPLPRTARPHPRPPRRRRALVRAGSRAPSKRWKRRSS